MNRREANDEGVYAIEQGGRKRHYVGSVPGRYAYALTFDKAHRLVGIHLSWLFVRNNGIANVQAYAPYVGFPKKPISRKKIMIAEEGGAVVVRINKNVILRLDR